jgi:hypothetical protein
MKTMKVLLMVVLAAVLALPLAGCKFALTNVGNDQLAMLGIKETALAVGYYVGKSKTPDDEAAVEAGYAMLRNGTMDEAAITQALIKLKVDDPFLAAQALFAIQAMGAITNQEQGAVLDLKGISPEAWEAAKSAYILGLAAGKSKRG